MNGVMAQHSGGLVRLDPVFAPRPQVADLSSAFDLIEEGEVDDSIPVFAGRERWMVWRRRPDGRMSGERPA